MNTHKKKISQDDTDSLQVSVLTKQKILSRKMRKKLTRIKKTSQIPTNSPTKPRDTLNYTVKFRGIYTVGWKYRRKTPNTVG